MSVAEDEIRRLRRALPVLARLEEGGEGGAGGGGGEEAGKGGEDGNEFDAMRLVADALEHVSLEKVRDYLHRYVQAARGSLADEAQQRYGEFEELGTALAALTKESKGALEAVGQAEELVIAVKRAIASREEVTAKRLERLRAIQSRCDAQARGTAAILYSHACLRVSDVSQVQHAAALAWAARGVLQGVDSASLERSWAEWVERAIEHVRKLVLSGLEEEGRWGGREWRKLVRAAWIAPVDMGLLCEVCGSGSWEGVDRVVESGEVEKWVEEVKQTRIWKLVVGLKEGGGDVGVERVESEVFATFALLFEPFCKTYLSLHSSSPPNPDHYVEFTKISTSLRSLFTASPPIPSNLPASFLSLFPSYSLLSSHLSTNLSTFTTYAMKPVLEVVLHAEMDKVGFVEKVTEGLLHGWEKSVGAIPPCSVHALRCTVDILESIGKRFEDSCGTFRTPGKEVACAQSIHNLHHLHHLPSTLPSSILPLISPPPHPSPLTRHLTSSLTSATSKYPTISHSLLLTLAYTMGESSSTIPPTLLSTSPAPLTPLTAPLRILNSIAPPQPPHMLLTAAITARTLRSFSAALKAHKSRTKKTEHSLAWLKDGETEGRERGEGGEGGGEGGGEEGGGGGRERRVLKALVKSLIDVGGPVIWDEEKEQPLVDESIALPDQTRQTEEVITEALGGHGVDANRALKDAIHHLHQVLQEFFS